MACSIVVAHAAIRRAYYSHWTPTSLYRQAPGVEIYVFEIKVRNRNSHEWTCLRMGVISGHRYWPSRAMKGNGSLNLRDSETLSNRCRTESYILPTVCIHTGGINWNFHVYIRTSNSSSMKSNRSGRMYMTLPCYHRWDLFHSCTC